MDTTLYVNASLNAINKTAGDPGDMTSVYIEAHSPTVIVIFSLIGLISCVSCSLAIAAMTRTKKIPFSTKFLSCGLLIFDCLFIVVSIARKSVQNPTFNVSLHVASMICIQLSFLTVAVMSAERYLLFVWPERYPVLCSKKAVPAIAFTFWGGQTSLTLTMRYGTCFFVKRNWSNVVKQSGFCNNIMTVYYMVFVFVFLAISLTCYGHIIKIIQDKTLLQRRVRPVGMKTAFRLLKRYQSTSLVLIYVISITATSIAYFVILVSIRGFRLGIYDLRLSTEIVSIVNCLIDPYLYVIWFRETRLELLKIFSPFSHNLRNKAEVMRYDLFDIVTSVKRVRKNRVHPGPPSVEIGLVKMGRIQEHTEGASP